MTVHKDPDYPDVVELTLHRAINAGRPESAGATRSPSPSPTRARVPGS